MNTAPKHPDIPIGKKYKFLIFPKTGKFYFLIFKMAYTRRRTMAKRGKRRPRGYARRGRTSLARLSKRVTQLAIATKPEKKFVDQFWGTAADPVVLGQVDANGEGYTAVVINPDMANGTSENLRTGARVSWTSGRIDFQFMAQDAATQKIRIRVQMWLTVGAPTGNPYTIIPDMYEPSFFVSGGSGQLRDLNSQRNEDYLRGRFKLLGTRWITLGQDTIVPVSGTQAQLKRFVWNYKFKKPRDLLFATTGSGSLTNGETFLLFMADSGNCSTSTASTYAPIPVVAPNTGLKVSFNHRGYFTDV